MRMPAWIGGSRRPRAEARRRLAWLPAGAGAVSALSVAGPNFSVAGRRSTLPRIDVSLLLAIVALLLLGTVMVYSSSIALADSPRYRVAPASFLERHVLFVGVSVVLAALFGRIPLAYWQRLAPLVFILSAAALVVVLVPGVGHVKLGARRWIVLGPLNLQPSEIMKFACVLYTADFTVRKQDLMHNFRRGFLPMGAVMAVVGVLLLLQPDLGSFGVMVAISMGILFLGGVNGRLFAGISAALAAGFALVIWASPWRRARIFAYLSPFDPANALGSGYQLTQSLIAFGRGEWVGVGLGASVGKLNYLPEAHTDFIFAVLGEELGLAGVLVVVVLFYWIVKRAFEIGRQAVALDRTFGGLVAQGVGVWLGVQSFINMGVATGLLPTKGLTLPLMSYGGSAMLSSCAACALLLRVDYENRVLMRGGSR